MTASSQIPKGQLNYTSESRKAYYNASFAGCRQWKAYTGPDRQNGA